MSGRRRRTLDLAWLVGLTLALRLVSMLPLQRPGYMDAAYYVDGALRLYEGHGFSEAFIWNYLDDPEAIPHPSHEYWMPLPSVLAYLSLAVFGPTFRAAQVPFALLSSLLPGIAYLVAYDVSADRRRAWIAGLMTTFSGFYALYWVLPESFAPYAVAGALCLWATGRGLQGGRAGWFAVAGLGAGAAHLSRADGLLLPGVVLLVGGGQLLRDPTGRRRIATGLMMFTACYLAAMAPWFARNVAAVGRPLSTVGTQTIWLTDYDDLYSYGKALTPGAYLSWGPGNILRSKLDGLWKNLGQVAFAGWMIYLFPLGLVGAWRLRRRVELRAAWIYLTTLYLAMSLAFTYPGIRGGMFHSLAALLPTLYAAAVEGLDAAIEWVAQRRRQWRAAEAKRFFRVAAVGLALALSVALYLQRLEGYTGVHPYEAVGQWMDMNASATARAMVNDPATYYYHTRRSCVAIPNGDLETALAVMRRYDAGYLVLDEQNPSLRALYEAPASDRRLTLEETFLRAGGATRLLRLAE